MSEAAKSNQVIASLFRTIEVGTFDRYYFTYSKDHNFESVESDHSSVSASIVSDTEIKVEVGEGFVFGPNSSFVITLTK